MRLPPLVVRRALIAPVVVAVDAALLVAALPLGVLAALLGPLTGGGRRPLRALGIGVAFAARHLGATVACAGLWVASGFGRTAASERMQRAHYAVLGWFVDGAVRSVSRLARVQVVVTESAAAGAALTACERPVVVLSRHAGEGDSLLVLHELLVRHGRRPRVVLHEALRVDPLIDVLGRRLPNRFVDPRGGDTEVEIAAMSRGLPADGAVLIFPEGGNFTVERRQRGIDRLAEAGRDEHAGWAEAMRNVLAPRPGGALAALEAAPDADVVFVGHAGFPEGMAELWRELPQLQAVQLRLWLVPAAEVPHERGEQIAWLFGWWRTIDAWVGEQA